MSKDWTKRNSSYLGRVYSAKNNQELQEGYDDWGPVYDATTHDESLGYVGPQTLIGYVLEYVPKDAMILDAGAGTGQMGQFLLKAGYQNLVAMDLTKGMLEIARKKNIYRELHQMVLGESLDFATDSFDAVVSCAVFTVGHAPASAFDELVRITKPGGYLAISINLVVYEDNGFRAKQEALESTGKWKRVGGSGSYQLSIGEPDIFYQIWVHQVI
jgi:SAM-dependent methyltransferase